MQRYNIAYLHEFAVGPDLVLDSVLLVDVWRLENCEFLDPGGEGNSGSQVGGCRRGDGEYYKWYIHTPYWTHLPPMLTPSAFPAVIT